MRPIFRKNEKKALFFDLHDTLIDREQSRLAALKQVLDDFSARWNGTDWTPEQTVSRFAAEWRRMTAKSVGGKKSPARARRTDDESGRIRCLQKAMRGSPLDAGDSFAAALWRRVREETPRHSVAYPDVADTLDKLAGSYRLAIVSNGTRARLEETLKASALDRLFSRDRVFVPDHRGMKKPNPDLFRKAMRRLGVTPAESVMIGNSRKNDVYGARSCGIDAVWLRKRNNRTVMRRIGKNRVVHISRCKQLLSVFETV